MRTKKKQPITLARLGKIKVGEKVTNNAGSEYPASLDYFRLDMGVDTYLSKTIITEFHNLFGDRPTHIPIRFYTDDTNEACSNYYELRDNQGKLVAIGDGERYTLFTGKLQTIVETPDEIKRMVKPLVQTYTTEKYRATWREVLRMRFIIPGIPIVGYWEFRSHGHETTIRTIVSTYDLVKQETGSCVGRPFVLSVQKHVSNQTGQNRSYPVVSLICNLLNNDTIGILGGSQVAEQDRIGKVHGGQEGLLIQAPQDPNEPEP